MPKSLASRRKAAGARRAPAPVAAAQAESSAVHTVLEEIKRRLRTGELLPGHRIIASELAAELQLSRVPVREALHVLAGEGVVDLHPNRGAQVRPISARDMVDMLRLLAALGKLGLSLAAEKAADPKVRAQLRVVLDGIIRALQSRNAQRFFIAAAAFHEAIHIVADNGFLKITYSHLHMDYFNRALTSLLPGDHWQRFERNYRAIAKALLAGDARETCREYEAHMQWAVRIVIDASAAQAPSRTRAAR